MGDFLKSIKLVIIKSKQQEAKSHIYKDKLIKRVE